MKESFKNKIKQSGFFNPQYIVRGLILFLGITVLAFTGMFIYNNGAESLSVWRLLNLKYILPGLFMILLDLFIGGLRNHIFIRKFVPGISQMVSVRANLANIFMGAITPSQSGGGPGQWYIFYRNGVSFPNIIATSFYNWISTLLFFPLSGILALLVLKEAVPQGFVLHLTRFGFSVFTTLLAIILIGLFAPGVFFILIRTIKNFIGLINKGWADFFFQAGKKGITKLTEYRKKYLGLIRQHPELMLYSFLLTLLLYLNKYAMAYVFLVGFGQKIDFQVVLSIMAVIYLLLYFAPSPGGSGIAEISYTVLLSQFTGTSVAISVTLLHRSFLVFIPAILGAAIVLKQLYEEKKQI